MNESGFLEPNFHKGGLHAREHTSDPTFIDVAGNVALLGAFNVNLNEGVIFKQGDPRFLGSRIDNNPLSHVAVL
jgi:hypothetical protein